MGNVKGEASSPICISSSSEHFCLVRHGLSLPEEAGVLLSFPDLGLPPDAEACSPLRICSLVYSSATKELETYPQKETMRQACLGEDGH